MQDGLYTVVQRGHDRQTARVVGSIGSYHYAPDDGVAVRAALADPKTHVVSLTITPNGYFLDPATREFIAGTPDVRADLVAKQSFNTAWAYLAKHSSVVVAPVPRRSRCFAATTFPTTPRPRGPHWCRSPR